MKVLFVSAVLPYPLTSGGQVRIYNLLKLLSKDHEITLYSFIRNEKERELVSHLSFLKSVKLYRRGRVWQPKYLFRSMTSTLPLLLSSYEHRAMREDIATEIKKNQYDLIHCEPFYVIPSVPESVEIPIVVAEHNIEYEVYQSYVDQSPISIFRPFLRFDVEKIQKQEEITWRKAYHIISVSPRDALVIGRVVDKKKISVIPNGVDTDYFSFGKKIPDKDHLKFLFVGNFLWMPNMKAAKRLIYDLWSNVREQFPHATLRIIGRHLSEKMQDDANVNGIIYKEFVEDIRQEYASSDMLLAPMTISGGTKFKILEAMASGCVVLTTKEGIEGIEAKKDIDYIEADTSEEFIEGIRKAVRTVKEYQTLAAKGRARIVLDYDWKSIADRQSDVWKGMA